MHLAAAASLALLAIGSTSAESTQLPNAYAVDTTFCYWIEQGPDASVFDASKVKIEGKGNECPVLLAIKQTTSEQAAPNNDVEYQFTATLNLNNNKFNLTQLEATGPDPTTRLPVEIIHANVHACSRVTVCDVFRDGSNRRISDQQTANFTDGKAVFNQSVYFEVTGEYNVFAHVVLPPTNSRNETYQFVAFTTTSVGSSADPGNSSSPGQAKETKSAAATRVPSGLFVVATLAASLLCLSL